MSQITEKHTQAVSNRVRLFYLRDSFPPTYENEVFSVMVLTSFLALNVLVFLNRGDLFLDSKVKYLNIKVIQN